MFLRCFVCYRPVSRNRAYCGNGSTCASRVARAIASKLSPSHRYAIQLRADLLDYIDNVADWSRLDTLDPRETREVQWLASCFWRLSKVCGSTEEAEAVIRNGKA